MKPLESCSLTDFNLSFLPPACNQYVGEFFFRLYDDAKQYRDDQGTTDRWLQGYRLLKGAFWRKAYKKKPVVVNLLAANIARTVANITARKPQAEVHSMDGIKDEADTAMSNWLNKWYSDSEQHEQLERSAQNMETYGSTVEKAVYNTIKDEPEIIVCDNFSIFPAPGEYNDIEQLPYICHAYPMRIDAIENQFGVEGVRADTGDDDYAGRDREQYRPQSAEPVHINAGSNYVGVKPEIQEEGSEALVIEIWIKDYSVGEDNLPLYPGGVRKVTVCNNGDFVLEDIANPSINPALLQENSAIKNCYLFDQFPFWKADSTSDSSTFWGYAMFDQVADILKRINELVHRIDSHVKLAMLPPFVLPQDTGIAKNKIVNRAGVILRPSSSAAKNGMGYLPPPQTPKVLFEMLQLYLQFFDRISQIEDVARGKAPNGVTAAAGVIALQERAEVMIQAKIRAIDKLVRERGRAIISLQQNFGTKTEVIDVNDEPFTFRGVDLAGRNFSYVVEAGSTVARTNLQIAEQAVQLYQLGAIDRQALLEAVNFPGWKQIVERVSEGQLGQALQILVQAGLPEEMAMELQQYLMQNQGGNVKQEGPQGAQVRPIQAQGQEIPGGSAGVIQ